MSRFFVFCVIFLLQFTPVFADDDQFTLKTDSETATVQLNIENFQTVQLFRKKNGESSVNIFEFSSLENTFSENADSDNCYFLKIYRNSGTPFVTDEKCVQETFFIGIIESTLIVFLLLLVFSFFAPRFIHFRFFSKDVEIEESSLREKIKILAGEDSKSVLIHSSSDWIGDPLNISVTSYLQNTIENDSENVVSTLSTLMTFTGTDNNSSMKNIPVVRGQRPFIYDIQRKVVPRSAVFHITENCPESALDSFKDRKDKRKMIFSQTLSGAVTDLLFKRKAFVSIEPFSIDAAEEKNVPGRSGAYLFLIVAACAVVLGSVLKTLGIEKLIDRLLLMISGGI